MLAGLDRSNCPVFREWQQPAGRTEPLSHTVVSRSKPVGTSMIDDSCPPSAPCHLFLARSPPRTPTARAQSREETYKTRIGALVSASALPRAAVYSSFAPSRELLDFWTRHHWRDMSNPAVAGACCLLCHHRFIRNPGGCIAAHT